MCKNKTWQHKRGMNKCKKIMYVAKYVHGNMAGTGPVCFFVDEEEPQALEGWREDSRASTEPSRSLMLDNYGEGPYFGHRAFFCFKAAPTTTFTFKRLG